MSIASKAAKSAFNAALKIHGEVVTYRRGDQSVDLCVNPGSTSAESVDQVTGLVTEVELQDWLVLAEDLKFGEEKFEPQRGDLIDLSHAGVLDRFVVNHPDANRTPHKRSDPHGVVLRIHSTRLETAPVATE
jgi:hypothetical protein